MKILEENILYEIYCSCSFNLAHKDLQWSVSYLPLTCHCQTRPSHGGKSSSWLHVLFKVGQWKNILPIGFPWISHVIPKKTSKVVHGGCCFLYVGNNKFVTFV